MWCTIMLLCTETVYQEILQIKEVVMPLRHTLTTPMMGIYFHQVKVSRFDRFTTGEIPFREKWNQQLENQWSI